MRTLWGLLFSALAALLSLPALALDPAGSAVDVLPAATGALDGTTIDLTKGDSIYMGQQIVTGPNGQVQIIFADDTHLVVGPSSTLVIAEYLMRNAGSASKFVVDALGGTFRFATGNSAKNAYEIRIPTGTIGVRGTRFDFDVDRQNNGETSIVLYEGAVEMCATGEDCVQLSEVCGVGVIPDQDTAEVFKRADQRAYKAKASFRYLLDQTPLRSDFRFPNVPRCRVPAQVAEANANCPKDFSGEFPDCVAPPCPAGYSGVFPNCEPPQCPAGYSGTYPDCEPPECPTGYSGTYPNCEAPKCPPGYSGTYPNCEAPKCPPGYSGTYPNCAPPAPPPADDPKHDNNGGGNGGEGDEGDEEPNNPGHTGHHGRGHGYGHYK